MENKPKSLLSRVVSKSAKLLVIAALAFIVAFVIFLSRYADETGIDWYYRMIRSATNYYPRHYFYLALNLGRPQQPFPVKTEIYWDEIIMTIHGPLRKLRIERKSNKEAEFKIIYDQGFPEGVFADTNLVPQTEYTYRFTACNRFRCSKPATFKATTYEAPPAPVIDLKISAVSPTEIDLNWHYLGKQPNGFQVLKSAESLFIPITNLPPNQMQFSDCHLWPGILYTYRVDALGPHFASSNSPVVSAKTPELERIGEKVFEDKVPEALVTQHGNDWLGVDSEEVNPDNHPKDNEAAVNSEIFMQTFDSKFNPAGKKVRVSSNQCLSTNPSLTWDGGGFGVAWLDSRDSKYCFPPPDGDSYPSMRVYFARVANGKREGQEVRVSGIVENFSHPQLFWANDHYDLFFNTSEAIAYEKLDRTGKVIGAITTVASTRVTWQGINVIQTNGSYGLAWAGSKIPGHNVLNFLEFTPGANNTPRPMSIAETCKEGDYCYSGEHYQVPGATVFWSGDKFGMCWKNYRGDVMVSMISSLLNKPALTFKALSVLEDSCKAVSQPPDLSYSNSYGPLCAWNGSELAVLAPVVVGPYIEYAFVHMTEEGQPIGKQKYLNIFYQIDVMPRLLGWEPPSYYTFYKNSMLVITP